MRHGRLHSPGRLDLCCLLLLLFFGSVMAENDGIYVFSNSLAKPNVIEKALSDKMGGATVKVFARFADFEAMIGKDKPSVVIAPQMALDALKLKNSVALHGTVKGKENQPLLWVSLGAPLDLAAKPSLQAGLLDIAGRTTMRDFLAKVAGAGAKIKLATKLEDLLPMLTFKSADAILVTQSDFEDLKGRTQASLSSIPAGETMGTVQVAKLGGPADKWIGMIKKLPSAEMKMLGVESWK